MNKLKKLSFNQILIGVAVLIVVINLVVIGVYVFNRGGTRSGTQPSLQKADPSSYALLFTSPVYSFAGEVVSVSGNQIEVSYQTDFLPPPVPVDDEDVGPIDETQPDPVVVMVEVSDQTSITQQEPFIPLIAFDDEAEDPIPPPDDQSNQVSLNDITAGDQISVQTNRDLRTHSEGPIEASEIRVRPPPNRLSGSVESIQDGTLIINGTIDGAVLNPEDPNQEYQVQVSDTTVIIDIGLAEPSAESEIEVSEIDENTIITVYFDPETSEGQTVSAEFIEVLSEPEGEPVPLIDDQINPADPAVEGQPDESDNSGLPVDLEEQDPAQPIDQGTADPAQQNPDTNQPPDAPLVP